jgi:hypothetical protein
MFVHVPSFAQTVPIDRKREKKQNYLAYWVPKQESKNHREKRNRGERWLEEVLRLHVTGREALLSPHLHLGRATREDNDRGSQDPRGGGNDGWPAQPRQPNRTWEPGGRPTEPYSAPFVPSPPLDSYSARHNPSPSPCARGMSPTAVAPVPSLTRESLHRAGSSLEEGEIDLVPELTMVLLTATTGWRSRGRGDSGMEEQRELLPEEELLTVATGWRSRGRFSQRKGSMGALASA